MTAEPVTLLYAAVLVHHDAMLDRKGVRNLFFDWHAVRPWQSADQFRDLWFSGVFIVLILNPHHAARILPFPPGKYIFSSFLFSSAFL